MKKRESQMSRKRPRLCSRRFQLSGGGRALWDVGVCTGPGAALAEAAVTFSCVGFSAMGTRAG
jgi:hypothetical protein